MVLYSRDMPAVIQARHLTLGYNVSKPVIRDFDAIIAKDQFIGIFGANGAGKTTLLRCLLGFIKPISGELTVLEHKPRRGNQAIGYMPQALPSVHPSISGAALLMATINGHRFGLPLVSRQDQINMEEIIALIGVENLVNKPFMELSGGEQRLLWLAQALLGKPKVLLLDEPLANLDIHHQHHLIALLARIQKTLGITLLLTAHDINPLMDAMTQALYLANGKAAIGSTDEIITSQTLSDLYDSPIEVIHHQDRVFVIHSHTGQIENAPCN